MKTLIKTTTIIITFTLLTISAFTQTPPPPNGGNGAPTGVNTPVGGGAPIGCGLLILTLLGAGYGAKKTYDHNKKKLAD